MDESFKKVAVNRVAMLALSAVVYLFPWSAASAASSAVTQTISARMPEATQTDHAMKLALHALRDAERKLDAAPSRYGEHRATAMALTKRAIQEVERGLEVASQENLDRETSDEVNVASTHLLVRRRLSVARHADVVGSADP